MSQQIRHSTLRERLGFTIEDKSEVAQFSPGLVFTEVAGNLFISPYNGVYWYAVTRNTQNANETDVQSPVLRDNRLDTIYQLPTEQAEPVIASNLVENVAVARVIGYVRVPTSPVRSSLNSPLGWNPGNPGFPPFALNGIPNVAGMTPLGCSPGGQDWRSLNPQINSTPQVSYLQAQTDYIAAIIKAHTLHEGKVFTQTFLAPADRTAEDFFPSLVHLKSAE